MNTTQQALNEYLDDINIRFEVRHVGQHTRDGWDCDSWAVTFYHADNALRRKGCELSTQYHTGLGHRKHNRPKNPCAADVLYSLIMDSSAASEAFEDWCSNYGYDTDSRKALDTYLSCQGHYHALRKVFTSEQRAKLSEMLADY